MVGVDDCLVHCVIEHVLIHLVGIRTDDVHTCEHVVVEVDCTSLCLCGSVTLLTVDNQTDGPSGCHGVNDIKT